LIGANGTGKSRLLSEARDRAGVMRDVHVVGESYTQVVPYYIARDILRQLLGLSWDDPDDIVLGRLREIAAALDRQLEPWLPLMAIAVGAEAPSTRDVDELAADARTAKLHDTVLRFLARELATPTLLAVEHVELLDDASASLLEALAAGVE